MSRTIDHAPAAATDTTHVARNPVGPRRARRWSAAAATERAWLRTAAGSPTTDLEDFLEQAAAPALCNTHRIAVTLFLGMIGLASILHVDVVVTGTGRLAADAPAIVVQPMQLAIIRQIRVKPGDIVHRGDILAELDPTFTQADQAALLAQQSAINALETRLKAELSGKGFEVPVETLRGGGWDLQQSVYQQRQAQYADRLKEFSQKLDGIDREVTGAELTKASLQQQVNLSREVEALRNSLYRAQTGSKLVYLDAQALRIHNERDLQGADIHLNALEQDKRLTLSARQAFIDDWRRDLLDGLVKVSAEVSAINESLTKAKRLNDLVVLAAQQDGVVLEVAKRSVGSVLNAAEPLITMVPSQAAMIADITVSSSDVGYVKAGDPVVVKVDAFPYQRHGALRGRLRTIGADSAALPATGPSAGTAYHHGQVELVEIALKRIPDGVRLIPGMTLTAEIKVGSRSVISYLTDPITRGFDESIREP